MNNKPVRIQNYVCFEIRENATGKPGCLGTSL